MKTIAFITLIVFGIHFTTIAQEQNPNKLKKNNYSGFYIGGTSGIGFTYGRHFGKFAIQVSGLPTGSKDDFSFNGGIQIMHTFYASESELFRLFNYVASSFRYHQYKEYDYCFELLYCNEQAHQIITRRWNLGIGAGTDISLTDILMLKISLGYGIYNFTDDYKLTIDGSIGLFFKF